MCRILIQSLVCSKIDNCNALLYGLSKHLINKLQSVQNTAARIIAKKRKNDHISAILQQLHWLPVEYRIMFKELLHVYTQKTLLRSTFKAVRLETVNFKTKTYGYRSYSVYAPYLWYSLPENIRSIHSLLAFKSQLKTQHVQTCF